MPPFKRRLQHTTSSAVDREAVTRHSPPSPSFPLDPPSDPIISAYIAVYTYIPAARRAPDAALENPILREAPRAVSRRARTNVCIRRRVMCAGAQHSGASAGGYGPARTCAVPGEVDALNCAYALCDLAWAARRGAVPGLGGPSSGCIGLAGQTFWSSTHTVANEYCIGIWGGCLHR